MIVTHTALSKKEKHQVIIDGLTAHLYFHPKKEKDLPAERFLIDPKTETLTWTVYSSDMKQSVSNSYPWELESGETNNIMDAVLQVHTLVKQ